MKNLFLLALAIVMPLSIVTPAQAAVTDIGLISGTTYGGFSNNIDMNELGAYGTLAGRTSILFTYNVNPSRDYSSVIGGSPDPILPEYTLPLNLTDFPNGSSSLELANFGVNGLFKTVITQQSDNFFTVLLSNLSNANLAFSTYFTTTDPTGRYMGAGWSSASIIPLPAALPLFGLGLAGLAGYRRLRKNKTQI